MKTILIAMSWLLFSAVGGTAQETGTPPRVRMRLVHEMSVAVPGKPLTIGLLIEHRAGWHTYWKNPGTVGMATRVEWTLPEGVRAGAIQWPRPALTKMGAYTVWGYEGRALLLTDLEVPPDFGAAQLRIEAVVTYMACGKTCHPSSAKLTMTLPVGKRSVPNAGWRERFDAVRRQQPSRLDSVWYVKAERRGRRYKLTLSPKKGANPRVRDLYFFGEDRVVSSNARQVFRRDGERLILYLKRETFTPSGEDRLRGVVYARGGFLAGGTVDGLRVDVAVIETKRNPVE